MLQFRAEHLQLRPLDHHIEGFFPNPLIELAVPLLHPPIGLGIEPALELLCRGLTV
jgi:hypothetical protein